MADIFQNYVPTLPILQPDAWLVLEQELERAARRKPIGILIPALYSDFVQPAMQHILETLADVPYIRRVYISLDRANVGEFTYACRVVRNILGERGIVIWNDSPGMQAAVEAIRAILPLGQRGKGRAVWTALGYALGEDKVAILAFHDADILTYDRSFIARLVYPVAVLGFQFAKGYYVRFAQRLFGRVTRLFYFPFVRALKQILGPVDFLNYMGDFRYPLSGEIVTFASILLDMQIPSDWSLEVGMLAEAYRVINVQHICQVEITHRYDHKHQVTQTKGFSGGLARMVVDIARGFFVELTSRGIVLPPNFFPALKLTFVDYARMASTVYGALSRWSQLDYSLHEERSMIELFAQCIDQAAEEFRQHPLGAPMLPTWRRLESALPGILQRIVRIVQEDTERALQQPMVVPGG